MRYGGEAKDGSSRESQIWYNPYHARELRVLRNSVFLISGLMNLCRVCRVALFLIPIYPVLETSKQFTDLLYSETSVRKCAYLFNFSWCLVSILDMSGTVSSLYSKFK